MVFIACTGTKPIARPGRTIAISWRRREMAGIGVADLALNVHFHDAV
jgi:hypothetical protein